MKRRLFGLILLVIMLPLVCSASSTTKKKGPTPYKGLEITTVNQSDKTIIVTDESNHEKKTYTVTSSTAIDLNGSSLTFNELKAGMHVVATQLNADINGGLTLTDLVLEPGAPTTAKKT